MKSHKVRSPALSFLTSLIALALLSGCGQDREAAEIDGHPLAGSNWRLVETPGLDLPESVRTPELRFGDEPGYLAGTAGVNQLTGPYTMAGGQMSFGQLATTRMAGPPEAMEFESAYLESLRSVDAWRMRGEHLELIRDGTVVAVFERAPGEESE